MLTKISHLGTSKNMYICKLYLRKRVCLTVFFLFCLLPNPCLIITYIFSRMKAALLFLTRAPFFVNTRAFITTFHNKLIMVCAKCRKKFFHLNKYNNELLNLTSRRIKNIYLLLFTYLINSTCI